MANPSPSQLRDTAPASADLEAFYEAYVEHHVPYHRSPRGLKAAILQLLPYWSWREWRFWKRWTPKDAMLLDLGCARGREIFREQSSRCVGADIASSALKDCAQHYDLAVQSLLEGIPFRPETFDCVVSSHVMGHIPPEKKDAVIGEIARVLKPGGRSLHVIETDSRHPLVEHAKKFPQLYEKYLIRQDGHIGLELAGDVIARFARHGLRCVQCEKMETGPIHPRLMLKWFDNEYADGESRVRRKVERARRTMHSPLRLALTEIYLGLHHYTAGQSANLDNAQFIAVVFEKPN